MASVPIPEQKESKQAYLRRCVRECSAQGMPDEDAFTACTLAAGQFQLANESPCRRLTSSVAMLEKQEAEPRRRCAILAYTGELITDRWSPFVIDLAGITLKTSIPVLLQHDVEKIVGQSDGSRMDTAGLHIFGLLSAATESAKSVLALADEAYPWQASIGVQLERQRVESIMHLCAKTGIGLEQAQSWITEGMPLQDVQSKALDLLAANPGGKPVSRVELGVAEGDKFRALAAEGIALAHGWKPATSAQLGDGSGQFRGMGLADMARLALERAGVTTLGLSRKDLADRLFSSRYRLAASVSDFSAVYMNVGQKMLMQSYAEAGRTFDAWTSRRSANDFRDMYSISLSEMGDLDKIGENEEYRTGSLSDHAESFRIYKYGKLLSISWEMIVNDDLSAFSRIPQMLGAATARKYSDIVYGLLIGESKMNDGLPLFSVGHANLVSGADISNTAMNKARLAMRTPLQKQGGHAHAITKAK